MRTIAVISQKGGVGKTTISTCLAVAAERDGKSVVLLDLDPQASACFWSDRRATGDGQTSLLVRDVNHNRLPYVLEKLASEGAELTILDCPPVHRDVAENAISAADLVLIPTRAEALDIRAMSQTALLVRQMGKTPIVVLTFCPPIGVEVEQAKEIITNQLEAQIAPVDMHLRKAYPRSQQDGLTPQEYEPAGKAAHEVDQLYAFVAAALFGERHGKATKLKSKIRA